MSLKIEQETKAQVNDPHQLLLIGFRNDLSRHRALDFLRQWAERAQLPPPPEQLRLPYMIAQVDQDTRNHLSEQLDRLGAIVRLTRIEARPATAPVRQDTDVFAVPINPPDRKPALRRALELVGLVLRPPLLALSVVMRPGLLLFLTLGIALSMTLRWAKRAPSGFQRHARPPVQQPKKAEALTGEKRSEINRLVREHEYGAAIDLLDAALQAVPDDQRTQDYRWRLYNDWARYELANGRFNNGIEAVEYALTVKEDPALTALQAQMYAKKSDWEAAQVAYEKAVTLGSKDPKVFLALASIHRQQGNQTAALDMLEHAQENGARGGEFEELKTVIVREQRAEADFESLRSAHFVISFAEGEDREAAHLVLTYLESAYAEVGHKIGHYPKQHTPVVIYAREDFQRDTHAPSWAGGLFDGRIKVPVRGLSEDNSELAGTMRHEYAHVVNLLITGGNCPLWLNEGVAMWAEESSDGDREEWARAAVQLFPQFELKRLDRSFAGLGAQQAVAAYAQSYLAVRYILNRYGHLALQQLLVAFTSTASVQEAFREALSVEFSDFERALRSNAG